MSDTPAILVPLSELQEEQRLVRHVVEENKQLKATNRRLHRRAQLAESAARQNIDVCRRQGVSLSKVLVGFMHADLVRRLKELIEPEENQKA